jgi:hypothetical protein
MLRGVLSSFVPLVVWLAAVALIARLSYPTLPGPTTIFAVLTVVGALVYAAGLVVIRDARGCGTLALVPFGILAALLALGGVGVLIGARICRP